MRTDDVDKDALAPLVRRVFGTSVPLRWERTPDGVSTPVYRLTRGAETFYLRLAEAEPLSLAVEAAVHTELRSRGLKVPAVVHYEPFDQGVRRSVLVTDETPGRPMISSGVDGAVVSVDVPDRDALPQIYRAAGRDLAIVNQVAVDGFGFVRRDEQGWPVRGEHAEFSAWAAAYDVAQFAQFGFTTAEIDQIQRITTDRVHRAPSAQGALLAHGDFDVSHVFHRNGTYTGMIDFGEIRGSDGWYDLATFGLFTSSSDIPAAACLPHLEAGYAEVSPLPDDSRTKILRTATMILAERLTRAYRRDGHDILGRQGFQNTCGQLHRVLLDEETAR